MKLFNCSWILVLVMTSIMLSGCGESKMKKSIDIQGHRGCRGLMPENTIPAFIKAIDLGVTTLELDCVISQDKQAIVSHEPWFNHNISSSPTDSVITETNDKTYNVYSMDYDEIRTYDVGMKYFERFPHQKKMAVSKPRLIDMILSVEAYVDDLKLKKPLYNIEIKRHPLGDNTFHPEPYEFVDIVMKTIEEGGIADRANLQCFDIETLELINAKWPDVEVAYLIENEDSFDVNLGKLSFTPEIYSPYYKLVNAELIAACAAKGMRLIPWTVNEEEDMVDLIELGVDGIISDYPDRVIKVSRKM